MTAADLPIDFPSKLQFLFEPHRYKIARGGRGSGKSWGYARALLLQGTQRPLRILCVREVQRSIKDSVHKLIADQIEYMGLSNFYEVTQSEVRGRNGTLFLFTGLSSNTAESIKSFEGIDRAWVEEGQMVSKSSFRILTPTIRKAGSEIWISFNPDLETDYVFEAFVSHPPEDCVSVVMNYMDNPWFPDVLEQERLHCKETAPKDYDNVWLGKCRPAVTGAIYYDEVQESREAGRVCRVPYDSRLKAHVIFDLGWNDAMTVSVVQRSSSEIRVIDYYEATHKKLEHYHEWLQAKRYNWGSVWLPHDGRHKDFKTGRSTGEFLRGWGWNVKYTPNIPVEAGIKLGRQTFERVYFDSENAKGMVECLKRYRRSINQLTGEPGGPIHDEWSHGADNFRYVCINADRLNNHNEASIKSKPKRRYVYA